MHAQNVIYVYFDITSKEAAFNVSVGLLVILPLNGASGVIFYGIQMKGARSCERYNHANSLYPLLSGLHEKEISPIELSP